MRTLHLISSMSGGGAERQLALLAAQHVRNGLEVHVGVVSGGENLDRLSSSGTTIHWIPSFGNHDPFLLRRILKRIGAVQPELIQTWLTQMDILGGAAALLSGRRWILSERGSSQSYPGSLKNWFRRQLGTRADAIVANSSSGARYWSTSLRSGQFLHVIPNGVPVEEIANAAPSLGEYRHMRDRRFILFAGRFEREKNIFLLLDALRVVLTRCDAWALLCGQGSEVTAVNTALTDPPLADRVFLGGFRTDLWSLMKAANALVSPSLFEGHPNVVLEAAACRCPLVVSDIPEHREFLDEGSAWLVDPGDPSRLADTILAALTKPDEARRRAARAKETVEAFSISAAAQRYEDIYQEVVGAKGA
jgi:glycosyltransferase involved in cell wall biosynthesis